MTNEKMDIDQEEIWIDSIAELDEQEYSDAERQEVEDILEESMTEEKKAEKAEGVESLVESEEKKEEKK